MQNRRKLIIDRLQRHLPKKPRAELVIDIHINTPLRLYCLPLDEIFKSCDIITIVVRKNMDVNEPERLSNITLRHKLIELILTY